MKLFVKHIQHMQMKEPMLMNASII